MTLKTALNSFRTGTWLRCTLLLCSVLLCAACRDEEPPPRSGGESAVATEAPRFTTNNSPRQAQPKLPTVQLFIGTVELTAEVARKPREIETGMMWRTNMAEMDGMLFVFPRPHRVSFWMRNTLVPLSCAYIDPEGVILELHDMKPLDETGIPARSSQVQYVLEVNQGWFKRHNVQPGMTVATQHGSLAKTFFSR